MLRLCAAAALLACAGCGDNSPSPPRFDLSMPPMIDMAALPDLAVNAAAVVQVGAGATTAFSPASVTIHAGETVAWRWVTGTHSVVSDSSPKAFADSATLAAGVFTATFAAVGTYPYHCGVHGAMMSGTVVVQ